jgi:hypothetical protein
MLPECLAQAQGLAQGNCQAIAKPKRVVAKCIISNRPNITGLQGGLTRNIPFIMLVDTTFKAARCI